MHDVPAGVGLDNMAKRLCAQQNVWPRDDVHNKTCGKEIMCPTKRVVMVELVYSKQLNVNSNF